VVLRHSSLVNGYDVINISKLDVLSSLPEILVCTAYRDPETGKELTTLPADLEYYERLKPVYERLPGWTEDLSKARKWEDLPGKAQEYVSFVEKYLGVSAEWIGVGGGREEMVSRAG
jgi:adenylosuccinate synthase